MEPRIQYAKTRDGVNIAFATLGEGMPLVCLPDLPLTHIQMEWRMSQSRRWWERLAEKRMLVRYDARGWGLSDRGVREFSLDALITDLEAVADRIGLDTFALWGGLQVGPVAIAYAARNPERVSHLILWCSYARASDIYSSPRLRAMRELLEKDWELYTETMAHVVLGFSEGEASHQTALLYRESVSREALRATVTGLRQLDVTDCLAQVQSPTLLLHRRQSRLLDVGVAGQLAVGIPNAQLVVLEGEALAAYLEDSEAVLRAIDEFLEEGEETPETKALSGLVTILFTDIESSTALTQRLGDAKAQELVRAHNTIVRHALKAHGGSEIKHTGDGIMASFPSASGALECAVAIQRAVDAAHGDVGSPLARSAGEGPGVRVRIGLNAGEPVAEERDLFGASVQLARRICDHAEPGQIVASNVVRELATGKGFLFSDLGDVVPKGFEDPVRLYEVRWRQEE